MTISQPPLPFPRQALEPYIGRDTVSTHYGKHHASYVTRTRQLLAATDLPAMSLEDVMLKARQIGDDTLFNNAAQAWNHAFYWNSLHPDGGGDPDGTIASLIDADFGHYDAFAAELAEAAVTLFGSGWVWLVLDAGRLQITRTANADNPLVHDQLPLLAIDVWEHAYYLDYRQQRPAYVDDVIKYLLNWDFANQNLDRDWRTNARKPGSRPRPESRVLAQVEAEFGRAGPAANTPARPAPQTDGSR